jgi:hypothetical protein
MQPALRYSLISSGIYKKRPQLREGRFPDSFEVRFGRLTGGNQVAAFSRLMRVSIPMGNPSESNDKQSGKSRQSL